MKITTVDAFLANRVQPEHRPIVQALREVMRAAAPDAEEVLTYGIPGWRRNRMLAVTSPTKKDITFAFSKGAKFEDKYGLLKGVGKVSKHLKFKDLADVDEAILKYYIEQALKVDAR